MKLRSKKVIPQGATVTYQRQYRRCGHPGCTERHGPYWYAYWREGPRLHSLYMGKELPPGARYTSSSQFIKDV